MNGNMPTLPPPRSANFTRYVGQAEVAALEAVGQLLVVQAEQVQDRRLQVVDVDAVLGDVEAELVGRADGRRRA